MPEPDPWAQAAAAYKGAPGQSAQAPTAGNEDWKIWGDGDGVPPPHSASLGSSVGDILSTPLQHIGSMFSGPYHALTDPATDAEKQEFGGQDLSGVGAHLSLGAKRMFVDPTMQAGKHAIENYHAGKYGDMANDAMDAIPVVGPWARNVENEATQKGGIAAMEGLATDALGPKAISKGIGAGLRTGGFAARMAFASPESRALATTRAIVPGEPTQLLSRALKPSVHHQDFEGAAQASIPSILKENPQPGIRGFADAANSAKGKVAQQYESLKTPVASMPVDTTPMVQPQINSIPAMNKFETPGIVGSTAKTASAYDMRPTTKTVTSPILNAQGQPITRQVTTTPVKPTLGELDDIRQDSNAKLKSFWDKAGGDRNAARSDPKTARTEAVNHGSRDLVYKNISQATGVPEQEIRDNQNLFGHLTDVSDVAGKRATVFGRQNPMSLQETLAATPGHPISGIMDFVGQRFLKNATGSDALVNSALDRFKNPTATPLKPASGAIPKIGMAAGNTMRVAGKRASRLPLTANPFFYAPKNQQP